MKKITLLFVIAVALNLNAANAQNSWTQQTSFGGEGRAVAVGFSIGNKGYIGTGSDGNLTYNDFWEFDPATNAWTQKANFAGASRASATGFSIGSKGYIGLGGYSDSTTDYYYTDFWEYDPATNTWIQKANFPTGRHLAIGFSIGNKGYIGTGRGGNYPNHILYNDLWEYDVSTDIWTQKADFAGTARWGATGFSIDDKGYIATGLDVIGSRKKDLWEYDPAINSWTQKANFPGTRRWLATGCRIGNKVYYGTGTNDLNRYNDFWEYDPSVDTWTQKANFGGTERSAAVAFSIGSKAYIGSGTGSNFPAYFYYNDLWEYSPECISSPEICNGIDDNCDGIIDNINSTVNPNGTIKICQGTAVTLTANDGAGTYQWLKAGNTISGATAQTYVTKKAGAFSVRETGFSCNTTSAATTIVVNPSPAATISYATLDLCGQSSVLLTANSGAGYSYQWLKGNTTLSGQTNQTYNATAKGTYKVIVTNSYGCSKASAGAKVIKSCKESLLDEAENVEMILYPNPGADHATIQFTLTQPSDVYIKVYNLSGKEIETELDNDVEQGDHSLTLNTARFSKGVYLVKMISDFGTETRKLIVQ